MRPEADKCPEVPLSPAGGPSASRGDTETDRLAMEARVAELRAYYDNNSTHEELAADDGEWVVPSLDDVTQFIKAADNGHLIPRPDNSRVRVDNPAPVRRKGAPPPPRAPETPPPKKKSSPRRTRQLEDLTDEELLAEAGIEPVYSTIEASQFFDRTSQWMYWGLGRDKKGPVFIYPDGSAIEPDRVGTGPNARRRFTLPIIKEILKSCHRRGNIDPDDLKKILRRIRINEMGGEWREREGWHKIKGKWVPPHQCEKINGKWVKKKGSPDADVERS